MLADVLVRLLLRHTTTATMCGTCLVHDKRTIVTLTAAVDIILQMLTMLTSQNSNPTLLVTITTATLEACLHAAACLTSAAPDPDKFLSTMLSPRLRLNCLITIREPVVITAASSSILHFL